ncbi:hypothetical protein [Pimelobacter simplex]|uniref:hypothetical protein n=1 Tax=Nocardioides simplex TaxID=2045 RepID=UPI003AAC98C3
MTDTPEHDPPLSPAQEAAVRRALAEAGGPEPMPDEVADRLDAVIAGLSAERTGSALPPGGVPENHPEAPAVIPLDPAARRRRTRARVLLGAAAAVAVVAVGIGIANDHGVGADDSAATADQLSEKDPARSAEGAGSADSPDAVQDADPSAPAYGSDGDLGSTSTLEGQAGAAPRRVPTDEPLRTVRVDRLREDLMALQRVTLPPAAAADYTGTTLAVPPDFLCAEASYGPGQLVGVRYDGKPAVVAFRAPVGSTQEAEVLACGTGDVLRSMTLATQD